VAKEAKYSPASLFTDCLLAAHPAYEPLYSPSEMPHLPSKVECLPLVGIAAKCSDFGNRAPPGVTQKDFDDWSKQDLSPVILPLGHRKPGKCDVCDELRAPDKGVHVSGQLYGKYQLKEHGMWMASQSKAPPGYQNYGDKWWNELLNTQFKDCRLKSAELVVLDTGLAPFLKIAKSVVRLFDVQAVVFFVFSLLSFVVGLWMWITLPSIEAATTPQGYVPAPE